jgi:hypothetical protein
MNAMFIINYLEGEISELYISIFALVTLGILINS